MSEITNSNSKRIDALADFSRRLINGESGRMLIGKQKKVIDSITPMEAMQVLDIMLSEGFAIEKVKASVGKIINVFFKSLSAFQWEKPAEGHFLYYLMRENRKVQKIMTELKSITRIFFNGKDQDIPGITQKLRLIVGKLKNYELHYIKNENILFPYIEKAFPEYHCLKVIWSFHDDFRRSLKTLSLILQSELPDNVQLNKGIGFFFSTTFSIQRGANSIPCSF